MQIEIDRDKLLLEKHMLTAQMVRNRLDSGVPLSSKEIIDGVRLSHEEYCDLIARLVAAHYQK